VSPAVAGPATPAIHHLEDVMGTVVTIDVYATPEAGPADLAALRGQLARARAILHRADEVFSTWQPGSPVSRLRRGEIGLAEAPAEVAEVLARCAAARELAGGWFDPWAMPGGVDPTGYVKGWAAQRALGAFSGSGLSGAIVNAAGDIASTGALPGGTLFRFGIADPASPRRLAAVVEFTGAVATSGTYERGAHLIDPRSGQPAARAASATVTGPDLGLADALATALAVAGEPGLALIGPASGYQALLIGFDRYARWTEGFPFASDWPRPPAAPGAPRALSAGRRW
jgi:FAD:protein FMN transferase